MINLDLFILKMCFLTLKSFSKRKKGSSETLKTVKVDFQKPNSIRDIADKEFEVCLREHKNRLSTYVFQNMSAVEIYCELCDKRMRFENAP